jgi:hypothetical protein
MRCLLWLYLSIAKSLEEYMLYRILLSVTFVFVADAAQAQYGIGSNPNSHNVSGYTRSNGTYVQPYTATNPNSTQRDNYGTSGNYNPNNGTYGTRTPRYWLELSMAKSTRNSGKPWTAQDVKQLKQLAKENTPTRVIGIKLGRTAEAIYNKASGEGISLSPTNQSPYNRRKPWREVYRCQSIGSLQSISGQVIKNGPPQSRRRVWVEARDELAARHLVKSATLKMVDFTPGKKLIFSPWLDDVVTSCLVDEDAVRPPDGHLRTSTGKTVTLS